MRTSEFTKQDIKSLTYQVKFNRKHRLVFFALPKVACTTFSQLLLRMYGLNDWKRDPHHRPDRPLASKLDDDEIIEMMNSPHWTRAVFLRDPVDRLLSAYLDKVVSKRSVIRKYFGTTQQEMSFSHFVSCVTSLDPGVSKKLRLGNRCDLHWRPQSYLANLKEHMPRMNFIGSFNHLESHSRILLSQIGAWQEYGASGWGSDNNKHIFQQNDARNRTNAQARLFQYYSDEMFTKVREAYHLDYKLIESTGIGKSSQPVISKHHPMRTGVA